MRGWMMVWALASSTVAMAQDVGEAVEITETVTSRRFPQGATPGPAFDAATKVEVLAVEGELVRVFAGAKFGWVERSAVRLPTATEAEAP